MNFMCAVRSIVVLTYKLIPFSFTDNLPFCSSGMFQEFYHENFSIIRLTVRFLNLEFLLNELKDVDYHPNFVTHLTVYQGIHQPFGL